MSGARSTRFQAGLPHRLGWQGATSSALHAVHVGMSITPQSWAACCQEPRAKLRLGMDETLLCYVATRDNVGVAGNTNKLQYRIAPIPFKSDESLSF